MANRNGKVPGTFVSDKDLNDLNELLGTYRDYILSHEARLEVLETIMASRIDEAIDDGERAEADAIIAAENEGLAFESPNDSEER